MAATYLPPKIMQYASQAKKVVGCNISLINPKKNHFEDSVWTSAALSYNYVSAAHVDDDCFFTALLVTVDTDDDSYDMHQEIAVYFCFPSCGKAIGLRPGDILLFNPLYYHCVSKRTKSYENKEVFLAALYLSTSVIGGNDNRKKTDKEMKTDS